MPAWKAEPLITYPPMEQWPMLNLPWWGFVERIDGINMPNLTELYCDYQPLTTLPWNDLRNLNYLGIYNSGFQGLELWRLPNLYGCYAGDNYNLIAVDAHGNTSLSDLDVYYCQSLNSINLLGCTNFHYLYAYGCALPQEAVDQLLADLVANGTTGGYIEMSGGSNAAPSDPDGIALKNILISRGWTIYTN